MGDLEATVTTEIELKVKEAQIQQLYKQTRGGLVGVLVVAFSVCVALWQVVPQWKLSLWCGILVLISIARTLLCVAFHRQSPSGYTIYRWARWHVTGVCASGIMWSLPPIFLWPSHSPVHLAIWPICIVALAASAVAKYCTWTSAYLPFLLLSVVPLSIRLMSEGGVTYTVLGLLGLFFIVVLLQTGNEMHAASTRSLETGLRNEVLNEHLTMEKEKEAGLTRKLHVLHDQLRQISMTDELTGLWNRRFLNATISEDVELVIRNYHKINHGQETALISNIDLVFVMVDLDHFKEVNDTYGHAAGDQVLIQIRQLLKGASRDTDTVIRWGGEEFLIVARNSQREQYMYLAGRILKAVEEHLFDIGLKSPLKITCSIGAAVFPFLPNHPEALNWEKIVELADSCLYAAKRSGRNAWVGVNPTSLATIEDLVPNFTQNVSRLIKEGKLNIKTSLPDCDAVRWS